MMSMLTRWGLAALLLLTLLLLTGWFGFKTGMAVKQGQWDASRLAQQAGEDAALKAAAQAIAKIEVKSEKHIQPMRTEIRTNTVYRDCQHAAVSLRNLNALITGEAVTGPGGLPEAKPTE